MIEGVTIFDFEVFAHDWMIVAKNLDSGTYVVAHNDNDIVKAFVADDPWLCGVNVKHYDNHIMKAVLAGFSPEEIKKVNDDIIIRGMNGWDIPELKECRSYFDTIDLLDDAQMGTSLKSFEAHMGMNIKETDVDFNIDRPLTQQEVNQTLDYCRADVLATEKLFYVRMPYLENKVALGEKCGMSPRESMKLTNAKLVAKYLQAQKPEKPYEDEREYVMPSNLLTQYIPEEVLKFFGDIHDKTIPDEEYFSRKLKIMLGRAETTIGFGGCHAAIPNFVWKEGEQ